MAERSPSFNKHPHYVGTTGPKATSAPPERKTENMSAQFVYLQFNVTPKGSLSRGCGSGTIAIELPSKHVTDWKLERPGRRSSDE